MKPKDFLEWYRYKYFGGKRMHGNYLVLRKGNPKMFKKLEESGKFDKEEVEMGRLLDFPKKK